LQGWQCINRGMQETTDLIVGVGSLQVKAIAYRIQQGSSFGIIRFVSDRDAFSFQMAFGYRIGDLGYP